MISIQISTVNTGIGSQHKNYEVITRSTIVMKKYQTSILLITTKIKFSFVENTTTRRRMNPFLLIIINWNWKVDRKDLQVFFQFYSAVQNKRDAPISWFTFWSVQSKPLVLHKSYVPHLKALQNCNQKWKKQVLNFPKFVRFLRHFLKKQCFWKIGAAGIKQLPCPSKIASFSGNLNREALLKVSFKDIDWFQKCKALKWQIVF